jgi:ABC-type transport system involved in multi-copper enzyme maturation permease subunit
MKLMGLPNWMHWLGWMLNSILVLSISISIVILLLFYTFNPATGPVILHGDFTLWWVVLFLYVMAATSFCFFISTFSERRKKNL